MEMTDDFRNFAWLIRCFKTKDHAEAFQKRKKRKRDSKLDCQRI